MTLVEVLVVIAIALVLSTLIGVSVQSAKKKAHQVACLNHMRQIGVALQLYADDHQGEYPQTSHTAEQGKSWIYALEEYIDEFDEVRICPADPKADERRKAGGTSYILNSFVFVPPMDAFGEPDGPAYNRPARLSSASTTITTFCCSDAVGVHAGDDHTHSDAWTSWNSVCRDIAPNRHLTDKNNPLKGSSNYLFADGHVESWLAADVKKRIDAGENIATIPGTL